MQAHSRTYVHAHGNICFIQKEEEENDSEKLHIQNFRDFVTTIRNLIGL